MEYIRHLERQNSRLRINGHSRNRGSKFNIRKPTAFKEEQSNLNSVSPQSPNLSLHSAKRHSDMIESDSN